MNKSAIDVNKIRSFVHWSIPRLVKLFIFVFMSKEISIHNSQLKNLRTQGVKMGKFHPDLESEFQLRPIK